MSGSIPLISAPPLSGSSPAYTVYDPSPVLQIVHTTVSAVSVGSGASAIGSPPAAGSGAGGGRAMFYSTVYEPSPVLQMVHSTVSSASVGSGASAIGSPGVRAVARLADGAQHGVLRVGGIR